MRKSNTGIYFILPFILFVTVLQAQTSKGQFLLNGEFSFFNNRDNSERTVAEKTISGIEVAGYNYVIEQYASSILFNPRIHYFINTKWSLGFSFGLRKVLSRRSINSFHLENLSRYASFSEQIRNESSTIIYAPRLESSRNWDLNKKFSLNLIGQMSWRWHKQGRETAAGLSLERTDALVGWEASSDSLTFTPKQFETDKTTSKEQHWSIDVFPQLRYALTPNFGFTASIGGIGLTQKYSDEDEGFIRSAPTWSVKVNPNSWIFGVYWRIHSEEEE